MLFREGDICSYINSRGKEIAATVIEVDLELSFKYISFGNDFCSLKTKNGHFVVKQYSELIKIKDIRLEKLLRLIK